jgi:hypothetical protein
MLTLSLNVVIAGIRCCVCGIELGCFATKRELWRLFEFDTV